MTEDHSLALKSHGPCEQHRFSYVNVAGALQDRGRATLIGETTFGKGTVQQWIELQDNGALKLTIAKWLTPDKRWIHRIGIVPDVAVPAPEQPDPEEDPALDRALETLSATGAVEGRRAA